MANKNDYQAIREQLEKTQLELGQEVLRKNLCDRPYLPGIKATKTQLALLAAIQLLAEKAKAAG